MHSYIDTADVAKIIRKELKAAFPGHVFSVTSKRYSGGSSIDCRWQDGPTEAEVKNVIGQYHGATFDGMIDLKSHHTSDYNGQTVRFGNDFLFTDRDYSAAFLRARAAEMTAKYNTPAPEVKEQSDHAYIENDGDYAVSGTNDFYWQMRQVIMRHAQETSAYRKPAPRPAPEPRPTSATSSQPTRQPVKTITADDATAQIIAGMTFTPNGREWLGILNSGRLSREMYVSVNEALAALGGKWNRKTGGHLFSTDPRPQLAGLAQNGEMEVVKDGYFPTPAPVVEQMIAEAELEPGQLVLEPSAGTGHIANLVRPLVGRLDVIELNPQRREGLYEQGHNVVGDDFLAFTGQYDRILMNPPFENGQAVEHVTHAWECLVPGGQLVAIMDAGITFRADKRTQTFRENLLEPHGTARPLPADSFKESGTSVNTVLVLLCKPF
jgi:protein-L-isoaspartate O-methyltransferase